MHRWSRFAAAAALTLVTLHANATPTADSGLERLEAALAALGGIEALDRAGGITWVGIGRDDVASGSSSPDFKPLTEALSYRADDGSAAFETDSAVDGSEREWIRRVFDGNGVVLTVDRQSNVAFWDRRDGVAAEATMHRNLVVHELLASLLSQRATLERLPAQSFFGQHTHPVAGTLPDGTSVTLYIDHDDVLLGARYPLEIAPLGSVTMTWVYDGLVHVEGLGPYPAGHRVYLGERLIREVRYQELHAGPDPALMEAPAGIAVPDLPEPDRA